MNKYRAGGEKLAILISLLAITPLTLLYLLGLLIVPKLCLEILANGKANADTLLWSSLILSSGYALFSYWWLIIKFRNIKFSLIPKLIKIGIFIGILFTVVSLHYMCFKSPFSSSLTNISFFGILNFLIFGTPLISVITLLIFTASNESENL